MIASTLQTYFDPGNRTSLDRWLRFAAPIQARYDDENAAHRVAELRISILFGLTLYNVYNISDIALLPDVLLLSIALRIGVVTSVSLVLVWLIGKTSPRWTERLITIGILNAYFVPVFLFWDTDYPLGLFTFGELLLVVVFANMLLALRFANAVVFTLCALATAFLALATKTGLDPSLRAAFAVQILTACAFSLYANYRQERRRCLDYLTALKATLQKECADADRQMFQDLSRTDSLTQLPNRRFLTEHLEEWLSERHAVTLMMIDIDHFKPYNDALGHLAGDDCLRQVAEAFTRVTAETEDAFCARLGGEEFTFVMRHADETEAARRAQALVQAITDLRIPHPARPDGIGIVTVSVGVARTTGKSMQAPSELLASADIALYGAKRRGRNRIAVEADQT